MLFFDFWDDATLNLDRGSLFIAAEFRKVQERVRTAVFDIAYLVHDAAEGVLDYQDSISPFMYLEDAAFISVSDTYTQVLPWLVSTNLEPVKIKTIVASSWHEALLALKSEIVRRALIAGHPDFDEMLRYFQESEIQIPSAFPDGFNMAAATETVLEYAPFDHRDAHSRLDIEAARAWRNWVADGMTFSAAKNLSTLSDTERRVFDYVTANPGKVGKQIASSLDIPESTLTRHVIPKLRRFGLRNQPGHGYLIEARAEPR